jgi:hypothetical protein
LDDNSSVMGHYLHKVYERLGIEVTGKVDDTGVRGDAWLMSHLGENNFWVRAEQARSICKRLNIAFQEPSYYRDIKVWLPQEQFGRSSKPPCPTCGTAQHVRVKDWPYPGRRVFTADARGHYFVCTRRYQCDECRKTEHKSTFYGYDAGSLKLLPCGNGDEFPAVLTHRSGVDKALIDLMVPLFDKGIRPHSLSSMLLEIYSKQYYRSYVRRERLLTETQQMQVFLGAKPEMFSSFSDATKYDGAVPTGQFLSGVYKRYVESIRDFLYNEVKKRGAEALHWDVSYKEAKHLGKYHGEPIFHGLVTATNEVRPCPACSATWSIPFPSACCTCCIA